MLDLGFGYIVAIYLSIQCNWPLSASTHKEVGNVVHIFWLIINW